MKKVLWHLSHHSSTRPDGWSGAPDEARWLREDLTPLVIAACAKRGIQVTTVDGDTLDHPEFHADYDAFCAPHYEANIHGVGGSFWGRAAESRTARTDDRLGEIFWRRYRTLPGKPDDHFEWTNPNVTDYYGFRLTSRKTPGILVEHGVGAPDAHDHDWLRANVRAIADVWADSLSELFGMKEEDVAFKDDPDAAAYRADVAATFDAIKEVLSRLSMDVAAKDDAIATLTDRIQKLRTGR
jgi:hypothetical protein